MVEQVIIRVSKMYLLFLLPNSLTPLPKNCNNIMTALYFFYGLLLSLMIMNKIPIYHTRTIALEPVNPSILIKTLIK